MEFRPEDIKAHALVSQAVAHFFSKELAHGKFFSKQEQARLEKVIKSLGKNTGHFERIMEGNIEDSAVDVYDEFYDYIRAVALVGIPHMKNVRLIIEAYNQDPEAMKKVAGEILK